MLKVDEAKVMAFPRKFVEQIIIGLYDPINSHLVKMVAFEFAPSLYEHFRREFRNWLLKIQRLRLKPSNRTAPVKFYYDLLFDYPFGGVAVQNMRSIMDLIANEYDAKPTKQPEEMVVWLRQFHTELAARLHQGEDVLDLIPE